MNTIEVKPIRVRFSLRYKLLISFFLMFSIAFAAAYFWFWTYSTRNATERIRQDLVDTLQGTLKGINGDEFEALVKEDKADETGVPSQDPRYQRHQNWLIAVNGIEPRAYNTYTYVKGSQPDEVLWVGDNYRQLEPTVATKFLESYIRGSDSLILQGFVENTVNMHIYTDPWGDHVSAYGPIKNSKGEVVGAVGIDFLADYVRQVQKGIRQTMIVSILVTYLVLFLLVYLLSSYLTRPIHKLTVAAQRVGEGDYEQDFSSLTRDRLPDEIDILASNFSIMVGKVYQREQTLRRQVEELKIEIDEAKRTREVSEIVDTDFFRDLQEKALRMRARRSGSEPEDASQGTKGG